jgi:hypothetical protein
LVPVFPTKPTLRGARSRSITTAPSHSGDLAPGRLAGSRLLACYRVRNDGKLKYLRRVPVAREEER